MKCSPKHDRGRHSSLAFSLTFLVYLPFLSWPCFSQTRVRLNRDDIGYTPQRPVSIEVPCRNKIPNTKVGISLRCETHNTPEAKHDRETLSFLSKSGEIIYLREGFFVEDKTAFPEEHAWGLDNEYAHKVASLYKMSLIKNYYLDRYREGHGSIKKTFDDYCDNFEEFISTPPNASKAELKKERKTATELFLVFRILREKCHSEKTIEPDQYMKYFQLLQRHLERAVGMSADTLIRTNNRKGKKGALFLPDNLKQLMLDAARDENRSEVEQVIVVNLRNLTFVNNIVQKYCDAVSRGVDLFAQIGSEHCPDVERLLKKIDPKIKVNSQEMGEGFSVMVKDFGGTHESGKLTGKGAQEARDCQSGTVHSEKSDELNRLVQWIEGPNKYKKSEVPSYAEKNECDRKRMLEDEFDKCAADLDKVMQDLLRDL